MRITFKQCNESLNAINLFVAAMEQKITVKDGEKDVELKFTRKDKYKLGRIAADVTREAREASKEVDKLLEEYGTPDERKPGHYNFENKEKAHAYQDEWDKLMATEVEIWGDPFKLDEFGELGDVIPVAVYRDALWLFDEGEEEEKVKEASA